MSKIETLHDLLRHELSDMRSAETQLTKALPKMAKKATDAELKKGFQTHLTETEGQLEIIDRVFEMLGVKPERITCEAMKGLVKEGEEAMDEFEPGAMLDVALIFAAQKVEHYEIASYGALCAICKKLDLMEEAKLLHSILDQEKATDVKLSKCAENINDDAFQQAA